MTGPAEFLAARLDEVEAAVARSKSAPADATRFVDADRWSAPLVSLIDEDRVLREVEAKRAILRYLTTADGREPRALMVAESEELLAQGRGLALPAEWLLREMVAVWSDHPDYDEAWRP